MWPIATFRICIATGRFWAEADINGPAGLGRSVAIDPQRTSIWAAGKHDSGLFGPFHTPDQMKSLLTGAGFRLVDVQDSTDESQRFFEAVAAQMAKAGSPPVAWRLFLGDDFPAMARHRQRLDMAHNSLDT